EIRPSRKDPVDEPALDEWNQCRHPKSGRRHRARDRQADGPVSCEHLLGKELAGLAQSCRIVGEVSPVDQFGHSLIAVDATRIDALTFEKPASLVGRVLNPTLLAVLGG